MHVPDDFGGERFTHQSHSSVSSLQTGYIRCFTYIIIIIIKLTP